MWTPWTIYVLQRF